MGRGSGRTARAAASIVKAEIDGGGASDTTAKPIRRQRRNESYSSLKTFKTCALRYKYQYIDKLEIPQDAQTTEAFVGKRVHEALDEYHQRLNSGQKARWRDLVALYKQAWQAGWAEAGVKLADGATEKSAYNYGLDCLDKYWRYILPKEKGTLVGTEMRGSIPLDEGVTMFGIVDRLVLVDPEQSFYEVIDYKTGRHLPSQAEIDAEEQLALYALKVREDHPGAQVRCTWHYLHFGVSLHSEPTPARLEELREQLIALNERIAAMAPEEFLPQENPYCGNCPFQDRCPRFAHALKVARFGKDDGVLLVDQLQEVRDQLDALKAEESRIQQALRAYAEQEGLPAIIGTKGRVTISPKNGRLFLSRKDHSLPVEERLAG